MDILTSGSEKALHLGAVARAITETADLFTQAAEAPVHSNRRPRFPAGPAMILRDSVGVAGEERDAERWDGLY